LFNNQRRDSVTDFDYPGPVSRLLTLGDLRGADSWVDYRSLGIGPEHVPYLIRLAQDEALHWAEPDSTEVWAPIHAWRALAVLHAAEAAEPLVELLDRIDEYSDDWVHDDLPRALGVLGPAAIPPLRDYLADPKRGVWGRIAAADGLAEIGTEHANARTECVAALTAQLERFAKTDPEVNAFVIYSLTELGAVETAPLIQKAFEAQRVDLSLQGDWEEVQINLGLIEERRTPRPRFNFPGVSGRLLRLSEEGVTPNKAVQKPGRNDPCWCGSGKKYKYCHLRQDQSI
jgi:hypothetical protein